MTDLLAGHVRVMVSDLNTALPHIKAGKIRVVATLNKERSTMLPDTPTFGETIIPGFDVLAWVGMFGPAGLPQELVDRYDAAIAKFISIKENRDALQASGCEVTSIGKTEFPDFVKSEIPRYNKLIAEAGIKPE
jgi:tripartite-type tricarboxylate transporter receptor subunit TctC